MNISEINQKVIDKDKENMKKNKNNINIENNKNNNKNKDILNFIKDFVIVVIVSIIVSKFIGFSIIIGESMVPTYQDKDVVISSNIPYFFSNPDINDIVSIDMPDGVIENDELIIKRVVATAGDTIEIKNGDVYRNNKLLKEDYINEDDKMYDEMVYNIPKVKLEKDEIFVMGDNRNHSFDSRYFGVIPIKYVKTKVIIDNPIICSPIKKIYQIIGKID